MLKKTPFADSTLASRINAAIWGDDLAQLPYWRALIIQLVRIFITVVRGLGDGQLSLRSMSLVYTTLLSLVPLLAISFSVLKGFGVHNQIEPLLLNVLEPLGAKGVEISEKVIAFVENVKAGVLGSLGLGLLVYTVISLMQKIEGAFNYAWHVTIPRTFAQRFSDYISVIVIGPVLVFSSIGLTASAMNSSIVVYLSSIEPLGSMIILGTKLMPYLLIVIAFTFFNSFMPNTKVHLRSAFIGALVAGILWETTGWAFATMVVSSTKYTAIYSAFASLIIFMIWVYLSWLILLVGASIAFYHQNPQHMTGRWEELKLSNRVREKLALLAAHLINHSYYNDADTWTAEKLSQHLGVPGEHTEAILQTLENGGLLVRTGDDPPAFIPSRPPETTEVKDILDVVRSADEKDHIGVDGVPHEPAVEQLLKRLDKAAGEALEGYTIKDFVTAPDAKNKPEDT